MCRHRCYISSLCSSHRPISVPMLEHTRTLENSTSADIGTDVARCLARSLPLRFHIGRYRYRCCEMPRQVPPSKISHRPISAPMLPDALPGPSLRFHIGLLEPPWSLPVAFLEPPGAPWSLPQLPGASFNLLEPPVASWSLLEPPWSLPGASWSPPGTSLELPGVSWSQYYK